MSRWLVWLVLATGCDRVFLDAPTPPDAPKLGRWRVLTAGSMHTCGITDDDRLFCWGSNEHGQLGVAGIFESTTPRELPIRAKSVSAGLAHTCAIDAADELWCWGLGLYGRLGVAVDDLTYPYVAAEPRRVDGGPWQAVTAGHQITCGLRGGQILCWGANYQGGVGDDDMVSMERFAPSAIASQLAFDAVSAGAQHACAIASADRSLWCWGFNYYGQVGNGTTDNQFVPTLVDDARWLAVAAGENSTCALREDGRLRCWGEGDVGQIGDGITSRARYTPQAVGLDEEGWTSIHAGVDRACARRADGAMSCWGRNDQGQLGPARALAVQAAPIELEPRRGPWRSIAIGGMHSCLVDAFGNGWCAGNNAFGQLGDGTGGARTQPVEVPDGPWLDVDVGADTLYAGSDVPADHTTCARHAPSGQLRCWGGNSMGQLADGTRFPRQRPVRAAVPSPVGAFAVGNRHVVAASGSDLWGWGYSGYGQVGPALQLDSEPHVIGKLDGMIELTGDDHTCVLANTGKLYCWGRDDAGSQLGRAMPAVPADLPALAEVVSPTSSPWLHVTASTYHTCATTGDGLYCWGRRSENQILTATGPTPESIRPPGPAVAAGGFHTCSIAAGGELWCWGQNHKGQVGSTPSTSPPTMPVHVAAGTSFQSIGLGYASSCAIDVAGHLWCWGANERGQLGLGTLSDHEPPTRVGDAPWSKVVMAHRHACGLRVDGSLWCWGDARVGQLGDAAAWRGELAEIVGP